MKKLIFVFVAVIIFTAGFMVANVIGFKNIAEAADNIWRTIGNVIFNQDLGKSVGIGTKTPSEKLSVVGKIESTDGGFKFPDGTVQATAAGTIPNPKTVIFADNDPLPFNSPWIDVSGGYNTMFLTVDITNYITQYDIHFTNDTNSSFVIQMTVNCGSKNYCPPVNIPLLGKYYRISIGTADGNITSKGYLSYRNLGDGAGNIAFMLGDAAVGPVLMTDGTVWGWSGSAWYHIDKDVPILVSDIVKWKYTNFLDKNGDIWYYTGSNPTWINIGHP